jgi:WD40 repeat protein
MPNLWCSLWFCESFHSAFWPLGFQVKTELKGHQKRITGLAFSTNLGVLVSSGADAQVTISNEFLVCASQDDHVFNNPHLLPYLSCFSLWIYLHQWSSRWLSSIQLCVWTNDTWEKKRTVSIQMLAGKAPSGNTRVQFSSDQNHLLVVQETQLAIYDASKMERIYQVAHHILDQKVLFSHCLITY